MATFAPNQDLAGRLDARERAAWATYKSSLEGLDGVDYDDAEVLSWARLQEALREIESDREQAAPAES
jgi:hypothetical protein